MQFLLSLLLLSTIGGQLLRIPYLQGTGITITDVILGIVLIVWLIKLITKQVQIKWNLINNLLLGFWMLMFISLLVNIYILPTHDLLISLFYYLRLVAYSSLFFVSQALSKKQIKSFFNLSVFISLALALLGFLQLKFFPDFEVLRMQEKGWDPHIGRLLSTWFDPNFLGGFFGFVLSLMGGVLITEHNRTKNLFKILSKKENLFYLTTFFIVLIALVLTYSRSAYLGFLVGMFLLGLIASRKILVIGMISVVLLFSFSARLQERVIDAYESAQALFNDQSVDTLDATARFRYQSWQDGLQLFSEKPVLGHGYNTLRYIQAKRGYTEWKSHASGGIDSSLLTLLVTTGLVGIFIYLIFFGTLLWKAFSNYKKNKPRIFLNGIQLGYVCGFMSLLVHSFFVNSLLFSFIMIFVWFWGGVVLGKNN